MRLHVREADEEACPLWLPLQPESDLVGRRRPFEKDRRDVVGPLAAVGAQPSVKDGHLCEGTAVTGEQHRRIEGDEAWQSGQVLDQAVAAGSRSPRSRLGEGMMRASR